MGVDTRRPPLPAPTEDPSSMDNDSNVGTDLATNLSRRTDQTSYSLPDDGSPITISTHKLSSNHHGLVHGRQKSQTSLLIEYFEAGKSGDKSRARPSVRVKVTPSSARKSRTSSDTVQITGIGKDRKPSYTRRISLGNRLEGAAMPGKGTEVSHSSESNLSGRPPVEIEVLNPNGSDLSNSQTSRNLRYTHNASDISSMPPESLLDTETVTEAPQQPEGSPNRERDNVDTTEHLHAPDGPRDRSLSRERITQKVMEKLAARPREVGSGQRRGGEASIEYEPDTKPSKERRRRSSRTHRDEDLASPESSLLSSNITPSQASYQSGTSKVSLNNPRLLEMVEDTVKRLILPEINQMRNEQKAARNLREFEETRRPSISERDSYSVDLVRRLSKSSSSPNIASKPKVVLNRHGDDPGEVLSRGDSERKQARRSSRESSSGKHHREHRSSRAGDVEEEDLYEKRRKEGQRSRTATADVVAGGILTAAALKHHDSRDSINREKRKKRSKSRGSRSQSTSIAETEETLRRKEDVPPMPFGGGVNESEVTRASILSAATERPALSSARDLVMPVREVTRGSVSESRSPASQTPTQSPGTNRDLESNQSNRMISCPNSSHSISTRARMAALAAAGLGGAVLGRENAQAQEYVTRQEHTTSVDTYGSPRSHRGLSTGHSGNRARDRSGDPLIPQALRPRSTASSPGGPASPMSPKSPQEFTTARSTMRNLDPESDDYSATTPKAEEMESWFQTQHEENQRYRKSIAGSSNHDSVDDRRTTGYTADSFDDASTGRADAEKNVRGVGANAEYVDTPLGVVSDVASLMDPSMISSVISSDSSAGGFQNVTVRDRRVGKASEPARLSPTPREIEAVQEAQQSPSQSRWSALRDQARALSAQTSTANSPHHSASRSVEEQRSSPLRLGASGVPIADYPMPEIGHGVDDASEVNTNPSDIHGHLTPDSQGKHWSYENTSSPKYRGSVDRQIDKTDKSTHLGEATLLASGAAIAARAAVERMRKDKMTSPALSKSSHQPSVEDEYSDGRGITPDSREVRQTHVDNNAQIGSPTQYGDEGYSSAAHALSPDVATPTRLRNENGRSSEDLAQYNTAAQPNDAFNNKTHARHMSANSQGVASPLYDSATGKGLDRIHSRDVVALMDHLTVRDAQRNARDTEILVTLVRSAAEMRSNFEEMKKFIAEQDRMIMTNTDRDADIAVQKVLGGPRPPPTAAPRTSRSSYDYEDIPTKRKNVFKRALKGLGMRSSNDLAKIEDMLNQLLDDVEDIKDTQAVGQKQPVPAYRNDSLTSYEKMRAAPDSGYEPEGRAGTSSTTNASAQISLSPSRDKQFHSGYDGRRGSENRVSTVLEGDEDDYLEPHEREVLEHQFENNERLTTPTEDSVRRDENIHPITGSQDADNSPEKQRKHKSNSSSAFGIPKFSRWSKTTSSSVPDNSHDLRREQSRDSQAYSEASRSGESLDKGREYYNGNCYLHSDDRLRSKQSVGSGNGTAAKETHMDTRSMRSSQMTRTPSPLIPGEGSSHGRILLDDQVSSPSPRLQLPHDEDEDEYFFDPKYQAHRNSLPLQHPQPRPGPTHRHQTNLESQAQTYPGHRDAASSLGTDSDLSQRTESDFDPLQWGSNPALSLARTNQLGGIDTKSSSVRPRKDDGPLVPQAQVQPKTVQTPATAQQNDRGSNNNNNAIPQHAYARMYYASPLGTGHLLEPIEEVRYSLETDRSIVRLNDVLLAPTCKDIDANTQYSSRQNHRRRVRLRSALPPRAKSRVPDP